MILCCFCEHSIATVSEKSFNSPIQLWLNSGLKLKKKLQQYVGKLSKTNRFGHKNSSGVCQQKNYGGFAF